MTPLDDDRLHYLDHLIQGLVLVRNVRDNAITATDEQDKLIRETIRSYREQGFTFEVSSRSKPYVRSELPANPTITDDDFDQLTGRQ